MITPMPCPICGQVVYSTMVHVCGPQRNPHPDPREFPPAFPRAGKSSPQTEPLFTSTLPEPSLTFQLADGTRTQLVIPSGTPDDVRAELVAAFHHAVDAIVAIRKNELDAITPIGRSKP